MFLTVKELHAWLNIKPNTLYLWVSQGRIPCLQIYGLVRFEREAIEQWLSTFRSKGSRKPPRVTGADHQDVDQLIAAAKRAVYTPGHGETITPSPTGEEDKNGAQ